MQNGFGKVTLPKCKKLQDKKHGMLHKTYPSCNDVTAGYVLTGHKYKSLKRHFSVDKERYSYTETGETARLDKNY